MAQDWFQLSLKHGRLTRAAKAPAAPKPMHWIERDLENILALNPEFLGVADHLPLRLQGVRSTVTSPDQAFIDEIGRVVVVEVKKVRASLAVLAQVIAYANHWQMLPPAETVRGLRGSAQEDGRADQYGTALAELQAWGNERNEEPKDAGELKRLGRRVLDRLFADGKPDYSELLKTLTDRCRGGGVFPCLGAPARMIAVAPDFSDECVEFAERLTARMVGVELVEVEIVRAQGEIYVGRSWRHKSAIAEPTWRLLRSVWPSVRDRFVVNGFADDLNTESFSLSLRGVSDTRIWIWASEEEAVVTTVVPDGLHQDDKKRRREIRNQLMDKLPAGFDRSERWLEWEFELPGEAKKVVGVIGEVADAMCQVFAQNATRR